MTLKRNTYLGNVPTFLWEEAAFALFLFLKVLECAKRGPGAGPGRGAEGTGRNHSLLCSSLKQSGKSCEVAGGAMVTHCSASGSLGVPGPPGERCGRAHRAECGGHTREAELLGDRPHGSALGAGPRAGASELHGAARPSSRSSWWPSPQRIVYKSRDLAISACRFRSTVINNLSYVTKTNAA